MSFTPTADDITRHFGVAALQHQLPSGVEILTIPPAAALELPPLTKPYWRFANGWVSIITDERSDEVANALRQVTPPQRWSA